MKWIWEVTYLAGLWKEDLQISLAWFVKGKTADKNPELPLLGHGRRRLV
jgi:hypothetical protein